VRSSDTDLDPVGQNPGAAGNGGAISATLADEMTGADSPVIADSSIEAMPSITSPSLGIKSPASTRTTSPVFNSIADTPSTTSFMPLLP
jgi:hypothetical protein